jgi:CspA family cold shock protein
VKWFNDQKGYGFITQEGVTEDIFVHHTAIKMEGFRTLAPGDVVEFEIKKDEKGLKAVNVTRTGQNVPVEPASNQATA